MVSQVMSINLVNMSWCSKSQGNFSLNGSFNKLIRKCPQRKGLKATNTEAITKQTWWVVLSRPEEKQWIIKQRRATKTRQYSLRRLSLLEILGVFLNVFSSVCSKRLDKEYWRSETHPGWAINGLLENSFTQQHFHY